MPPEEITKPVPSDADPAATPPVETPPAAAPATVTVSQEQWDRLNAQVAHMGGQIQGMAASVNRAPPPAPVDTGPQYSDEQLAEMLESGEGRKILAAQRYIADQQTRPLVNEFVNFRSATLVTAESLGREVVEASGKIPHYKDPDIKRQVDAFLSTLPVEARANKESLVLAHNYVVGQPENFERLVKARVDEEVRKRAGDARVPDASTAGGRVPASAGSTVKGVEDLLGKGAAQALRAQGRSADEFAKRMGYKTWAEYAAVIEKDQQESEGEEAQ